MALKESERAEALKLLNSIPRPLSPTLPIEPIASSSKKRDRDEVEEINVKNGIKFPAKMEDKVIFPKERLKALATGYREKGRELKHAGDKVARENLDNQAIILAVVLQMDAVLLYVYAFWCDDTAVKNCLVQNWQSIFGLLAFVKSRAEKNKLSIIVGLCLRIEAHILQTLSNHEQKSLSYKSNQLAPSPANPSSAPSPNLKSSNNSDKAISPSTAGSPPDALSPQSQDILKSYTKASGEIFRIQRSFEESSQLLSPLILAKKLPKTWKLCRESNLDVDLTGMILPILPLRFSWPVSPSNIGGIPHVVAFSRSVLLEWAKQEGLDFNLAVVSV